MNKQLHPRFPLPSPTQKNPSHFAPLFANHGHATLVHFHANNIDILLGHKVTWTSCVRYGRMLFSCEMDDSLYLFCSGLVIAALIWLFNPFGKLESLIGCLLNSGSAKLPDGVRSFDDMPGPTGWPFFGDIFSYLKDADFKQRIAQLKSNFAKYGPIYKRTILGRNVVLIQDPKDVETVIKADGRCPMRPKQTSLKAVEEYSKSRGIPKGLVVR